MTPAPYQTGIAIFLVGIAIMFGTFFWLIVNVRSLMKNFDTDGSDVATGPARKPRASRGKAMTMLVIHFVGWAIAGFAWVWMLADNKASAPEQTPVIEPLHNTIR